MTFDLIIVGGGMVGASLACALGDTHLRIALVDATPLVPSEDPRLIALNDKSFSLLQKLQVWKKLSEHVAAIKEVHVSHRGHFGMTRLSTAELEQDALGYVVPAKYINAALYEKLTSTTNVTLFRPATLKKLTQNHSDVTLTIEATQGEIKLTGRIVIGADGTHSTVRQLAEFSTETIDYQQSAIVTMTELRRSHQHIAYERFQKSGAIAMLPLTGNRAATIWTDNTINTTELMQLSDRDFLVTLQKQFGYRLGRFETIGKRHIFPLQFIQTQNPIKQRVMLIGNAARTLHPIASQGLNLALYEVDIMAEHLAKQNPETISLEHLPDYSAQLKGSVHLSHHLTQIFSSDFFMLNLLRQAAMIGLDICPPVKKLFLRVAMTKMRRKKETHDTLST